MAGRIAVGILATYCLLVPRSLSAQESEDAGSQARSARRAALPALSSHVVDVRLGEHLTYTRVVLELDEGAEYRLDRGPEQDVLHLRIDAVAAPAILGSPVGLVESIEVEPTEEAAVARIRLREKNLRVREQVLTNPPRIVLDLRSPEKTPARSAVARQRAIEAAAVSQAGTGSPRAGSEVPDAPAGAPAGGSVTSELERLEQRIEELEIGRTAHEEKAASESATREWEQLKRRVEELEKATSEPQGATAEQKQLERRVEELERATAEPQQATRGQERLEQRVDDLETAQAAQEHATRLIIRDAVSTLGSKINQFVTLGGTLEVLSGWSQDFTRSPSGNVNSAGLILLNTAELDFEIQTSSWVLGSIIIQYDDGTNALFPTDQGFDLSVDRINLDTAFFTIGDPMRFPPFATFGRMILPFGISTGDPVADVLTLEDPLTIDAFEMRETAVGFGVAFPTPAPTGNYLPTTPPPVMPLVVSPFIRSLSRHLGYDPLPTRELPTPIIPPRAPPPFNVGFYAYDGDTFSRVDRGWKPLKQIGATVGFRTKGHCGPYDEAPERPRSWLKNFCPWSIDVDVDFNSSVFDSRFLEFAYRSVLGQIGYVPGMAASLKATGGPVSLVLEWNGALKHAKFVDGLSRPGEIRPSAVQVSVAYQFDWNPWVDVIGAQGTYLTASYSQSWGLAGVLLLVPGPGVERRGFLPERKFIVGVGEWILDGVRLVAEYSRSWDYSGAEGGTGINADGFSTAITLVW